MVVLHPCKEARGRESTAFVVAVGEAVLHHMTNRMPSVRPKSEPVWLEGVYLGTVRLSNEYPICIWEGVLRVHSIKRFPEIQPRDVDLFDEMKGAPWIPDPR